MMVDAFPTNVVVSYEGRRIPGSLGGIRFLFENFDWNPSRSISSSGMKLIFVDERIDITLTASM